MYLILNTTSSSLTVLCRRKTEVEMLWISMWLCFNSQRYMVLQYTFLWYKYSPLSCIACFLISSLNITFLNELDLYGGWFNHDIWTNPVSVRLVFYFLLLRSKITKIPNSVENIQNIFTNRFTTEFTYHQISALNSCWPVFLHFCFYSVSLLSSFFVCFTNHL